jgi:hypothetical protein
MSSVREVTHPPSKLRVNGAMPPVPQYVFMAWTGKILPFVAVSIEWLEGGKCRAEKSEKSQGQSEGV